MRVERTHREWIPTGLSSHGAVDSAYESGDPSDGISSESEQSPRAGNGTERCPQAESGNASDQPTADSDSSGTDSSGNDEINNTRELRDVQLESQASPAESFTICAWNVTGLLDKLADREFLRYVQLFDIVCLGETFLDYLKAETFPEHFVFVKPAVKLSLMGRRSGGIIALVRKQLTTVVENIEVDFDNILLLKLSGSVFNVDRDVFLICCYVCPQHSPYYRDKDFKCDLQLVEECIMYVNEKYDCPYVFVCGDLNSRTADRNNYCNNDVPDENSDSESEGGGRKSMDKTVNTFGAELLDVLHSQNANFERGLRW